MKIAAYTIGDINTASSRLRSFYLFSHAEKFNLEISRPVRLRDALGADTIHIQKKLSYKIIFAIVIYRLLGVRVIFDIDDQPIGYRSFFGYLLALLFSSIITVDTDARKNYWQKLLFFKKIIVISDIADSNNTNLNIRERRSSTDNHSFFWIGYSGNLQSLDNFIEFIKNSPKYKLIVSTEEKAIKMLQDKYPFIKFIPWFDAVAYDDSINATFMVLNHNFDKASQLKSENKMVLAILAGFVPIVSRTPAYEKLAKSLDADFLVFDNIRNVAKISENLIATNIQAFFDKAGDFINNNYSRDAVLSDFAQRVLCH